MGDVDVAALAFDEDDPDLAPADADEGAPNAAPNPRELFKRFDTNGNGTISYEEFKAMLPRLGIEMSAAKALKFFRTCDTDGSGAIEYVDRTLRCCCCCCYS